MVVFAQSDGWQYGQKGNAEDKTVCPLVNTERVTNFGTQPTPFWLYCMLAVRPFLLIVLSIITLNSQSKMEDHHYHPQLVQVWEILSYNMN